MKAASFNRVASCSGDFCPVTWGVPCRGRTQPPQVCVFFWSISRGMVCSLQAFQEVGAPRIGESWRRSGVCGGDPLPCRGGWWRRAGLALTLLLVPQPFRCAHCHYSCNISGSLKRHYNRKHPNEEYSNVGTGELAADALIQQGRWAAMPLCLARPPGAALRPPSARPPHAWSSLFASSSLWLSMLLAARTILQQP